MRICLAGPPTVEHVTYEYLSEFESDRSLVDRIPLGVLTLAANLQRNAFDCHVVDLNRSYLNHLRQTKSQQDFISYAVEHLTEIEFDVLGLGTMCSSYPTTLQIAAAIKARRPQAVIMLGGPQASVVDQLTIEKFNSVDLIVRGEADNSLISLAAALRDGDDLGSVPGITFKRNGTAVRTSPAPALPALDELPLPSFHLLPDIAKLAMLPLEIGRGCPFSCTFCSTNDFFRRRFRLKKPDTVIEQMRALNKQYSIRDFILTHDMFTVDRKRVVEFCEAMLDSETSFQWSCSARTDSVDEELLSLMARAGCRGIFFGIETGSARMQRVIDKDLDLLEASAMIGAADQRGIYTTVSTIIGFPEETFEDVKATFSFVTDASRLEHITPQVGLLAPLAGTPVFQQYRERLKFDPILADFSYPGWFQNYDQFEMIQANPEIFCNFYAIPTKVPREYLFELKLFFHAAFHQCRWLLAVAHQELGGIISVFEKWLRCRHKPEDLVRYYTSPAFKKDIVSFLEAINLENANRHFALCVLVAAHKVFLGDNSSLCKDQRNVRAKKKQLSCNPMLCPDIEIKELPGDVEKAIIALKTKTPLAEISATRHLVHYGETSSLVPLEESIGKVLTLCDGSRTASDIVHEAIGVRLPNDMVTEIFWRLKNEDVVTFLATEPSDDQDCSFHSSSCVFTRIELGEM